MVNIFSLLIIAILLLSPSSGKSNTGDLYCPYLPSRIIEIAHLPLPHCSLLTWPELWNSKHIFSDPSCQLIRAGTWDSSKFLSLRWSTLVARLQVLSLGPWVLSLNRVSTQQTLVKWAQIMRDRDSTRNLGLILLTAVLRFKDSSSTNSCVALRKVPVPVNLSVKWANGNTTTE